MMLDKLSVVWRRRGLVSIFDVITYFTFVKLWHIDYPFKNNKFKKIDSINLINFLKKVRKNGQKKNLNGFKME